MRARPGIDAPGVLSGRVTLRFELIDADRDDLVERFAFNVRTPWWSRDSLAAAFHASRRG